MRCGERVAVRLRVCACVCTRLDAAVQVCVRCPAVWWWVHRSCAHLRCTRPTHTLPTATPAAAAYTWYTTTTLAAYITRHTRSDSAAACSPPVTARSAASPRPYTRPPLLPSPILPASSLHTTCHLCSNRCLCTRSYSMPRTTASTTRASSRAAGCRAPSTINTRLVAHQHARHHASMSPQAAVCARLLRPHHTRQRCLPGAAPPSCVVAAPTTIATATVLVASAPRISTYTLHRPRHRHPDPHPLLPTCIASRSQATPPATTSFLPTSSRARARRPASPTACHVSQRRCCGCPHRPRVHSGSMHGCGR